MIDSYRFGAITVDSHEYSVDVIIYPDRIDSPWWRKKGHGLCLEDIEEVLDFQPEVLVIGTGNIGCMKIKPEILDDIRSRGIEVIALLTGKAVEKYNEISKTKKTIGAFHVTC